LEGKKETPKGENVGEVLKRAKIKTKKEEDLYQKKTPRE